MKTILKLSILPIESIFIIEFHVGLKVTLAAAKNKIIASDKEKLILYVGI